MPISLQREQSPNICLRNVLAGQRVIVKAKAVQCILLIFPRVFWGLTVLSAAASEVGFSLVTTVAPVVEITRLDFVKIIVGWDPLDARFGEEPGEVDEEVPPPSSEGVE